MKGNCRFEAFWRFGHSFIGKLFVICCLRFEISSCRGRKLFSANWAQAVAVSLDGYWVLITEMNFSWRGGGFGRVDFRYIHVGAGVYFIH